MFLKSLELTGFKSFADHTRLEFGPGMTAVVGPNGCGKSNIFDAICWVLGEQSVKFLRGSKQEDFIFNGTDFRKPQGMAEVSLTFADCEKSLGLDYNEITVTRRVLRSGEGQFFINKTPCRLKDIQRLFMDTGVGTSSYSLMGQGRIDMILSSRPDERREVFEEASGITKYKADRRESLRKLEETENNLLRLVDIGKEKKTRIISLQRQAGKASRYKKLQNELQQLDIYTSLQRLRQMDSELETMDREAVNLNRQIEELAGCLASEETQQAELRERLAEMQKAEAVAREVQSDLAARRDRLMQEQESKNRRLDELRDLKAAHQAELGHAAQALDQERTTLQNLEKSLSTAQPDLAAAEQALAAAVASKKEHEDAIAQAHSAREALNQETLSLENALAKQENDLQRLDSDERELIKTRARLEAEHSNLQRVFEECGKRVQLMAATLDGLRADRATAEDALAALVRQDSEAAEARRHLERERSEAAAALADTRGAIRALAASLEAKQPFSEGAKLVLDPANPLDLPQGSVVGAFADKLQCPPEYRVALDAALKTWLDAALVLDWSSAMALVRCLQTSGAGDARLLCVESKDAQQSVPKCPEGATRLFDHVGCDQEIRPLLERLLGHVFVMDELPAQPPAAGALVVTRTGITASSHGAVDFCDPAAPRRDSPFSQRQNLLDAEQQASEREEAIRGIDARIAEAAAQRNELDHHMAETRAKTDETRMALAMKEGENLALTKDFEQARDRLATVAWELHNLNEQRNSADQRAAILAESDALRTRRNELKQQSAEAASRIQELDRNRSMVYEAVSEAQTRANTHRVSLDHVSGRIEPLKASIANWERQQEDRAARIAAQQAESEVLMRDIEAARNDIPLLEADIAAAALSHDEARRVYGRENAALAALEKTLHSKRDLQQNLWNKKSTSAAGRAVLREKRQNLLERVTSEHRIAPDALALEPEPEWDAPPDPETLDAMIAERRARLEAMGPVNLVAIEEYQQLEEEYAFLSRQMDDLAKSKQQLMDVIRRINQTTSEMFSKTFEQINANFQSVFHQLFGGGTARLMLVDDEDILECGIEIIASPPGKKLQAISLLSGGERTMTAVALLFAIYMVKPSPFCVLDELDASLDESNIKRFIKILQGFLHQSQFVVITHNRQTISAASVLYGVTMEEAKVSKIVSMRFNQNAGNPEPTTSETTAAESGNLFEHTPQA